MRHFYGARVQVDAARLDALQHGGAAAVLAVAQDRRAERGTVRAQLVRAPGARHQLDPSRLMAGAVDHPIVGDRALPSSSSSRMRSKPLPPLLAEREVDAAALGKRNADRDRPVGLRRLAALERAGEERRRARGAAEQQNAAGVAVEPMGKTRPLLGVEAQRVEQPVEMARGAGAALHGEPGRLVDGDDVVVAVDHQIAHEFASEFDTLGSGRAGGVRSPSGGTRIACPASSRAEALARPPSTRT